MTSANNSGIWADPALQLVVRKGASAPCVPGGNFNAFSSPVLNDLDQVAFRGTMGVKVGSGMTSANASGLWTTSAPSNALTLIAREGVASPTCGFPPCVPTGAKYKRINSFAMPDGGGVVFVANLAQDLAVGVTSGNDVGLWRSDAFGVVDLLLREGDVMLVNSVNETVASFAVLDSPLPLVAGSGRTMEHPGGNITCSIKFISGVQGVFNLH